MSRIRQGMGRGFHYKQEDSMIKGTRERSCVQLALGREWKEVNHAEGQNQPRNGVLRCGD